MTNTECTRLDEIEAILEHRETTRSLALAGNGVGLWDWQVDRDILWWDENMFALYGNHEHEFKGTYADFIDRVHPDDTARVDEAVKLALRNQTHYFVSYRVVASEITRTIISRGAVRFNAAGDAVRMAGICIHQEGFIPLTPQHRRQTDIAAVSDNTVEV
jgi:PAS domain-containing protein